MDYLTIETPEQIPLELPLAGIRSRFLALALDTLIQFIAGTLLVMIGLALVFGGLASWRRGGIWTAAIFVLLVFLLQFGYFAFFEAIWNGQTLGNVTSIYALSKTLAAPSPFMTRWPATCFALLTVFPEYTRWGSYSRFSARRINALAILWRVPSSCAKSP